MNWKQETLCRILLMVAKLVADNELGVKGELDKLIEHLHQAPDSIT